jgi:hypothetical protein
MHIAGFALGSGEKKFIENRRMLGMSQKEEGKLENLLKSQLTLDEIYSILGSNGFLVSLYQITKDKYVCSMRSETHCTVGSFGGVTAREAVINAFSNVVNRNDYVAEKRRLEAIAEAKFAAENGYTKAARYQAAQKRELGKIVLTDL